MRNLYFIVYFHYIQFHSSSPLHPRGKCCTVFSTTTYLSDYNFPSWVQKILLFEPNKLLKSPLGFPEKYTVTKLKSKKLTFERCFCHEAELLILLHAFILKCGVCFLTLFLPLPLCNPCKAAINLCYEFVTTETCH